MTTQEMKARKKELGYTNKDLARLSGVPLSTINKLFGGTTSAPRRETVLALESVLNSGGMIQDPGVPYQTGTSAVSKHPGEYTLDDYLALPDDVRVELIDGVFYDMAAPLATHQFIGVQIMYQIMNLLDKRGGACRPLMAPCDVQLDKDNKTVVQPDIMILCNPKLLIKNGRVFGAPDFIIEILSPSTRRKDMTLKYAKYANAGVREYWLVDPKKLQVMVYDLEHDAFARIYQFTDQIPILIWDGECSIDFQAVYEYIKDYLGPED